MPVSPYLVRRAETRRIAGNVLLWAPVLLLGIWWFPDLGPWLRTWFVALVQQ